MPALARSRLDPSVITPAAPDAASGVDKAFAWVDVRESWGRVLRAPHRVARPRYPDDLPALMTLLRRSQPGLPVGLGRSYGDSNLNPEGRVVDMTGLDRMIAFDPDTGVLRAEAGCTLSRCLHVLVPAGWFLPTTPGTRFVTLGGAVANDVHGKNHHAAGTFGASVTRIGLLRTDGSGFELAPGQPLFHATVGGLGLTGVIAWVEFQAVRTPSAWLDAEDIPFGNLGEYFDIAATRRSAFEHTMAWIDCRAGGARLGRGIFSGANWSQTGGRDIHRESPRLAMPVEAPSMALNKVSVRLFNVLYNARKRAAAGAYRSHYEPFLYPLDAISGWNRLYGPKGFYQYQCVLPPPAARDGVTAMMKAITASGEGSFLGVLKDFGPATSPGMLSFPMEGTTLALDFQNHGDRTLSLFGKLDAIVREAGGRLYPAKDGRISADMFRASFPRLREFRAHLDPGLSSSFWRRVSA